MARRIRIDDEPDDDDDEGPLASDQIASAEPALVRCPYCGKMTSDLADVCHACGSFIFEDEERGVSRGWRWVGIVLLVMSVLGLVTWRL